MDQFVPPRLPHVMPPARRPGTIAFFRAMLRNPIEVWPEATYQRPFLQFEGRLRGVTTFVCAPELIRKVLVEHADQFIRTRAFRRALEPALGDAILTSDGPRWRAQRRIAAPVFRPDHIPSFVPPMLEAARATRDAWLARPDGSEIGLAHEMMQTTFAIIAETMLSGRGSLDTGRIERSITRYLENLRWQVVYAMLNIPAWTPYPGRRALERANAFMRGEVFRVVRERRASGERRGDLLDQLLDAEDPDTGGKLSDLDVANNILTFVAAGHETTALALTWAFFLLAKHPAAEAEVLAEIASVTGGGEVMPEHLDRLEATRRVVQEAMRLYPPAAIIPRLAASDVDLGEVRVPAGSTLIVPVYAVHRHAALWPDPHRFDPANFAPDAVRGRHRYAYLPFGAGPRICIGMGFAMIEAVAILAVLLPAVRMTVLDEERLGMRQSITLRPTNGMPMRIARRDAG